MRVLLLFRGAPGVGKSTFIKEHGLEQYTLSSDNMRLIISSPTFDAEGNEVISMANDKKVWQLLFDALDTRMQRGEFTVIDATNSKTSELNRYKELCDKYRYRAYVVDMTDVPIEVCKERNRQRPSYKVVPDSAIEKMYSRFETQKIPGAFKVIKPEEIESIYGKKVDLTGKYKKIHAIGDIHGCYTALRKYFDMYCNGGFPADELFIFTGDYLDRGIENADTFRFLNSIAPLPNVNMLEGNHEIHIQDWGYEVTSKSTEFELHTRTDLERAGVSRTEARQFYRRLWQCAHFVFGDNEYIITHGGLSCLPENLTFVPTALMVRGVGNYKDMLKANESFLNKTPDNVYQIHGHRNVEMVPVQVNERCFNLEGQIEFGGCLRVLQITPDGKHTPIEVKNEVFRELTVTPDGEATEVSTEQKTVAGLIMSLRNNRLIREKTFGNFSSFNFSEEVFRDKTWNEQTVRARGLFIDVAKAKIVGRSYDKFFNIGEVATTKLDWLGRKLQFPVSLYRKENGYLGIVSYDEYKDDLFVSSKSTPEGDHAKWLREILEESCSKEVLNSIKNYTKDNSVSFIFEAIDPVNDPHIIEYDKRKVVLLDIIKNDVEFSKLPYDELCDVAKEFGLEVKDKAIQLDSWQEFMEFYDKCHENDYKYKGEYIEGFVLEDSSGFMTKMKLQYYNFWKMLRGVAFTTLRRGYISKTSMLTSPISNYFYGFVKTLKESGEFGQKGTDLPDIITLRKMFYDSEEGKRFAGCYCDWDN